MTLRIRKQTPDPNAPRSGAGPPTTGVLRPDLLAAGARRLAIIAALAAGATIIFAVLDRVFVPLDPRSATAALWLFGLLGNLGLSLSVAWIAYREMLSPEKLLDLGLLYEVAEALCLGIMFHSMSMRPDVIPRGCTWRTRWRRPSTVA